MMTINNIHGRQILSDLLDFKFDVLAVIVEHKSKFAENSRNYLKNNFYDAPSFSDLIKNTSINVHYVEHHNNEECVEILKEYKPDYIILGGTRILKESVIKTSRCGILNSHPALLPKYQGLDCVGWSIINDDPVGATVHFIDSGIDTGPIILQDSFEYDDCHSLIEVRIKAMKKCSELIIKSLILLEFSGYSPKSQNLSLGINYSNLPTDKLEYIEQKLSKNK